MVVLLNIEVKCSPLRAKLVKVSGHLPTVQEKTMICVSIDGWDVYQDQLVKAIEPLSTEQLELRISPHLRSIGSLARHIVRTRASWLYGLMGEGGPDIAAIAGWGSIHRRTGARSESYLSSLERMPGALDAGRPGVYL
jgi:hypothetical protein